MLLLWLSLVAMVPFDMVRFDGSGTDGRCQRAPVVDRMLELAKVGIFAVVVLSTNLVLRTSRDTYKSQTSHVMQQLCC